MVERKCDPIYSSVDPDPGLPLDKHNLYDRVNHTRPRFEFGPVEEGQCE